MASAKEHVITEARHVLPCSEAPFWGNIKSSHTLRKKYQFKEGERTEMHFAFCILHFDLLIAKLAPFMTPKSNSQMAHLEYIAHVVCSASPDFPSSINKERPVPSEAVKRWQSSR